MPILNVPDEVEIELTHRCNWNCRYCAIRTHDLPAIPEEAALEKVKKAVQRHKVVTFSGGEPGFLSRSVLEKMLDEVENAGAIAYLNTNGFFLKRYRDLACRFREIIYHCSQDLDDSPAVYRDLNNIRYMLVVDDINYPKLKSYLGANPDIVFDVVPASYEPGDFRRPLSVFNRMDIVRKFSGRITPESRRRLFVDKDFDDVKYL